MENVTLCAYGACGFGAMLDPRALEFHFDEPSRFLCKWYTLPHERELVVWRAEIDMARAIRAAMIATQAAAADKYEYAIEWLHNLDAAIEWRRVGTVGELAS